MEKLNVLFLCTGNSCRSQMAEGWAKKLKGDTIAAYSAGVQPHGMNARAIQVMQARPPKRNKKHSAIIGGCGMKLKISLSTFRTASPKPNECLSRSNHNKPLNREWE
jgi:hypothetical protein